MNSKLTLRSGLFLSAFLIPSLFISINAVTLTVRGTLPSVVYEASGLDYAGSDFWTHNDGGSNKIYRVSKSGSLKQTLTVSGASNTDWEDITHHPDKSYMYIGDFGNNNMDRRNLKVYRLPYPSSTTTSITAAPIYFSYPDQTKFPSKWKNFDVEGFIHHRGKLCLFTKGEGSAIGYTKLYTIPDDPGTHVATLVDSFYVNSRITGAAINANGDVVVLISNTKIYIFSHFSGTNIFNGTCTKLSVSGSWTQKEGVSFYSNSVIYIVEEGSPSRNQIYSFDISSYLRLAAPSVPEIASMQEENLLNIKTFPNPASTHFYLETGEKFEQADIFIISMTGQIMNQIHLNNTEEQIRIETEFLKPGIYTLLFTGDNRRKNSVLVTIAH